MRVTVLQGENSEDYRRPILLLNAAGLKKKKKTAQGRQCSRDLSHVISDAAMSVIYLAQL